KNMKSIFETLKDQMMKRLSATTDDKNAMKIAMEMEKEGHDYYVKAAKEAKKEKEKKLFERLSYEEDKHYKILENTLSYINDSGNWYMWNEYSIVEG
ncbi:MAG: ferritin family protein, partial [bacterium]